MGKDNKNRELGKGLSQRKDGRYSARFVTKTGKRVERYFDSLPQARNWLDDARHKDKHNAEVIRSCFDYDYNGHICKCNR